jgi:two-component system, chemotaxis family, protein-glutamate methylesterase/glutaminase
MSSTRALRILIAEDSPTVRRRLVDAFSADAGCMVAAETADGDRAFELCQRLRPDVVALDLALSKLNGVELTRRIMAHCPTPIVVFSSPENRTRGLHLLDALSAGAVDAMERPSLTTAEAWMVELLARVKLAARVPSITHPLGRLKLEPEPLRDLPARAVVMGASTGGPAAMKDILQRLPRDFPLPILLVMHLAEQFELSMVEWLGKYSPLPVRQAVDGEVLPSVCRPAVVLARANRHMVLSEGLLRLTHGPERHSCRPSVDVLFESVARELGGRAIGCLLTGMGRDGAEGMDALRRSGAVTLAQDEASSVVFGMPREAIRLGAAKHVVGLQDIPGWLAALARRRPERGQA